MELRTKTLKLPDKVHFITNRVGDHECQANSETFKLQVFVHSIYH